MNTENNSKVLQIELTLDDVNVVLAGLGELPAKVSLNVIEKIRNQAVSQLKSNAPSAENLTDAENTETSEE